MSSRRRLTGWLVAVVLVALLWTFVQGIATRPAAESEARIALVALEMLHRGDFIVPRRMGELEDAQPPLHVWSIALAAGLDLAGVDATAVRLVSRIALLGTALLLWLLGSGRHRAPDPLVSLVFLTSVVAIRSRGVGESACAPLVLLLAALACFELGSRYRSPLLRWTVSQTVLAAATLAHGLAPLLFYPPVLFVAWRTRRETAVSPAAFALGLALFALLVGGWLLPFAAWSGTADPWRFLRPSGAGGAADLLARLAGYPLLLFAFALPWALAPLTAGARAVRGVVDEMRRDAWLLLAAAVVGWTGVLFLLAPELRAGHLLTAVPCAAVLLAATLRASAMQGGRGIRRLGRHRVAWLLVAVLSLGLGYGLIACGAPQDPRYADTASALVEAVDGKRPVVWHRDVDLRVVHEMSRRLERSPVLAAPVGQSADYVDLAGFSPPARGELLLAVPGHRLWRVEAPEAWSLMGVPLYAAPLSDEVRADFEAKLSSALADREREPGNIEAAIWVGRRTAYLGRYREALALFAAALQLDPNDHRLYRHLGHRHITLRQLDAATRELARAAELIRDLPDEVEPDGLPNARNLPRSTSHSNIWYHLGLAHYLKGKLEEAAAAYEECMKFSGNDDMLVATTHWYYMTLRRSGREEQAAALLEPIGEEMEIIENDGYHRLLLMYKGLLTAEELAESALGEGGIGGPTVGYGVANWYFYNGRAEEAVRLLRRVLDQEQWAAFGYIAAEVDLARLLHAGETPRLDPAW